MNRIARLILANLNLKVFVPLLTLALVTTWWGLFHSTARFAELSGGLRFVDMQRGLTPEIIFDQFGSYAPDTVTYYLAWSVFDFAWPFITFTTMLFIAGWLLGFVADKWQKWFGLFIASAYLTVLMDWGENVGFMALVTGMLNEPMWLAQLTLALPTEPATTAHIQHMVWCLTFRCKILLAASHLTVSSKKALITIPIINWDRTAAFENRGSSLILFPC